MSHPEYSSAGDHYSLDTCKSFGVDAIHGFPHKRELSKLLTAWDTARVQHETKVQVDSAARAHGQPVTLIEADWAVLRGFRERFGKRIHASHLPSQSALECHEERVASGSLRAEPLTTLLSMEEETRFKDRHPEAGKQ